MPVVEGVMLSMPVVEAEEVEEVEGAVLLTSLGLRPIAVGHLRPGAQVVGAVQLGSSEVKPIALGQRMQRRVQEVKPIAVEQMMAAVE